MIKNNYIKCETCGEIIVIFMDDKFVNNKLKTMECNHCGGKHFTIVDSDNNHSDVQVKTRLTDNRKLNKEKYMSEEYKAKRAEINRVYKDRKGLFGKDKSKFL